ncbi:MAG TPA: ABC transporter ATP-binding protein [Mesorhizobium sp.]
MSLIIDNLHLAREGIPHLDGVTAEFGHGSITAVIGRTLAGKTTLTRAIAGLQAVDGGSLRLDGKPFGGTPAWRRDVAMVYQQFINYPHLSVFENVAFPLRKRKVAAGEIARRVTAALEMVGLASFGTRRPTELSGGQQQRVALARALVRRAGILLLDEPLVNLDYKLREQLREEFRGLLKDQTGAIVIYNTTEPSEAMMLGNRIVVMHEGKVLQAGAPAEIFDRPASVQVARIVNDPPMNIFSGIIENGAILLAGGLRIPVAEHLASLPPGSYRFGIRAGELRVGGEGDASGKVTFSEVSGSETFVYAQAPFGDAVLQIEGVHAMANGTQLSISVAPDRLFAFSAEADGALLAAPVTGDAAWPK